MIIITLFTFQSPFPHGIAAFEEVFLPLSRALKYNIMRPLLCQLLFKLFIIYVLKVFLNSVSRDSFVSIALPVQLGKYNKTL